ncbi:MAG: Crp/Fnr family transcriptional regulator [Alphaproteobacteria bacterium]|nr:Crp/Fnr family transcriptional regulator [Alphaproteobacteria bacterium]
MTVLQNTGSLYQNQLVRRSSPDFRKKLMRYMRTVELPLGATVCEAGGALNYAYFPEGSVLSLLTVLENGSEVECANIGREGAFGLFAHQYGSVSFNRCVVQLEGPIMRCDVEPLHELLQEDTQARDIFISFSEALLSQVMQSVGCNALHKIEQRICRWLLMMHDRSEGDNLSYTHEFLARIIGANRTSITQAAQSLQSKGLVTYRRGLIQIQDRAGMEAEACECYMAVKRRYDACLKHAEQ